MSNILFKNPLTISFRYDVGIEILLFNATLLAIWDVSNLKFISEPILVSEYKDCSKYNYIGFTNSDHQRMSNILIVKRIPDVIREELFRVFNKLDESDFVIETQEQLEIVKDFLKTILNVLKTEGMRREEARKVKEEEQIRKIDELQKEVDRLKKESKDFHDDLLGTAHDLKDAQNAIVEIYFLNESGGTGSRKKVREIINKFPDVLAMINQD